MIELHYSRPRTGRKTLAVPAFVCGVCSGPVAMGSAFVALESSRHAHDWGEPLAVAALLLILAGALVFTVIARATLGETATKRDLMLANFAIVAPVVWTISIFIFVLYEISRID